jgi:A/G-specific adenine glycosylase
LLSKTISSWYIKNKRDLPWRNTTDPYIIWLSEVILQQTRVNQGMSYFYAFVEKYPTIHDLANATEDDVLKLWQGLGYYSRARNLHQAAKQVVLNYNGTLPNDYKALLSLKGVGEYTAAAIISYAYNQPYAVLDGNVFRVLSRYFGIQEPINSPKGKKIFTQVANEVLDKKNPALHNQAIMEYGALLCTPVNPNCLECELRSSCVAYEKSLTQLLPFKEQKLKIKERFFYYIIIQHKNTFAIKQRVENDIWKGLFDFPLVELETRVSADKILANPIFISLLNDVEFALVSISDEVKHLLTHQRIFATFIHVSIPRKISNFDFVTMDKFQKLAVPKLIERYTKSKLVISQE